MLIVIEGVVTPNKQKIRPSDWAEMLMVIIDNQDFFATAERHLHQCDYKAAAVYTRSAFEKLVRKYCVKKKKTLVFNPRIKDYSSEDFWAVTKSDVPNSAADIETYRSLVLNAFSNYNTEQHEIKAELEKAIQAVKNLKKEIGAL